MAIPEVVRIVGSYVRDDGGWLERTHGAEAATAVGDMAAVLEARLEQESPYGSLWDAFCAEPDAAEDELVGALEALVEADPGLAERVNAFLEEYHAAIAAPPAATTTLDDAIEQVEMPQPDVGFVRKAGDRDKDGDQNYPIEDIYRDHDYSDEGEYLYGNVARGIAAVGEGVMTAERPVGAASVEGGPMPRAERIRALFAGLYTAIDDRRDLGPKRKRALKAELEQAELRIATEDAGSEYERALHCHLHEVEELDPVTFRLVLDTLAKPEAGFAPVAQRVALALLEEQWDSIDIA